MCSFNLSVIIEVVRFTWVRTEGDVRARVSCISGRLGGELGNEFIADNWSLPLVSWVEATGYTSVEGSQHC